MTKTTQLIGAGLIATALSGCGSSDYKPTAGMPVDQLFAEACSSCHGDNGEGKLGFILSVAGTEVSTPEIVTKIRQGGHVMPDFPNISEEEATALAAYLKSQ
jgi:mono/diheme cytochrome c family protein